jgi:hypothetical protein
MKLKASMMKTSRAQADRLLDLYNGTIESLQRSARIVGWKLCLRLM